MSKHGGEHRAAQHSGISTWRAPDFDFYRRRPSGYPVGPESDRFSGLFGPSSHPLFLLISARATEFGSNFGSNDSRHVLAAASSSPADDGARLCSGPDRRRLAVCRAHHVFLKVRHLAETCRPHAPTRRLSLCNADMSGWVTGLPPRVMRQADHGRTRRVSAMRIQPCEIFGQAL